MNLSQVEVFLTILEAGGFNQAAQRLGCSQPTVSQQLRRLEEELGAQLIVRNRAHPALTAHGARFKPYARRLLHTAERARAAVKSNLLAIGASSNIGVYFLHKALRAFELEHPELPHPEVRIATNPEIIEQISGGQIDVAVLEWWVPAAGLIALPWKRERLVMIVCPSHPLAQRNEVSPDVLLSTPLLGGESGTGTGTLLRSVFGERANQMKVAQNLGSTEAVKQAVRSNLGVSLVLEGAVADEVRHGDLVAIPVSDAPLEKEFQIVLPEDTPASAAAWKFVKVLTNPDLPKSNNSLQAAGETAELANYSRK